MMAKATIAHSRHCLPMENDGQQRKVIAVKETCVEGIRMDAGFQMHEESRLALGRLGMEVF